MNVRNERINLLCAWLQSMSVGFGVAAFVPAILTQNIGQEGILASLLLMSASAVFLWAALYLKGFLR